MVQGLRPRCPHCGGADFVLAADRPRPPEPRDAVVCTKCGGVSRIADDLRTLVACGMDDWKSASDEERSRITEIKGLIPIWRSIQEKIEPRRWDAVNES